MKKLFFVALMAGVFGFQSLSAQDNITIRVITNSNGDKIAVGVNDDSLCFDNVTVNTTTEYVYDHSSGILTFNGQVLQTYSGRDKNGINNFFLGYGTSFYVTNGRNHVLGSASLTNDNGQYSINN